MNERFKLWELSLLIALCVSLCLGAWAQARQTDISSGLVRLHVIADSDSDYEQALKLRVRDAVLSYLEPKLSDAKKTGDALGIIRSELDGISAAASGVSEGRRISVTLGREYYPTRFYTGFSLPAGKYESLRVIIGDGSGHNWWCVVFPPLCVSAAECADAMSTVDNGVRGIISGDGRRIGFRIVELWGELMELLGSD